MCKKTHLPPQVVNVTASLLVTVVETFIYFNFSNSFFFFFYFSGNYEVQNPLII